MEQKCLGLIVGHTDRNQGARSATGYTEYSYNSDVARLARDYAFKKGYSV